MVRIAHRKIDPLRVKAMARLLERLALSIPEFCQTHNLSQSKYFEIARRGEGPEVFKVDRRTLISIESAAAWRKAKTEAAKKDRQAKALAEGARQAQTEVAAGEDAAPEKADVTD